MGSIPRKKQILLIVFLASLFVAVTCILASVEKDIDVNSGRLRKRVFVYGIMLSSQEYDTKFSKEVARLGLSSKLSEWHSVDITRPGMYGPIFDSMVGGHGHSMADFAIVACDQVITFFEIDTLNDQERRIIISKVMQALKQKEFRKMDDIACEYFAAHN